jgi:membrane protease YdiL (CAAX protease family)
LTPDAGEGAPPPPPERRCESCDRSFPWEVVYCTACGHLIGTPLTALEMRRTRARFRRGVEADLSRIRGLVAFYLFILLSHLGAGLALHRDSILFFATSAAMTVIAAGGAVVDRARILPLLKSPGFGWRGYLAILVASPITYLAASALAGALRRLLPVSEFSYSEPLLEDGFGWMWVVALIAVEPGIFEELAFRGFILGRLEGLMKPRDAIIATSAVFAIIHIDYGMFPFLFLFGAYVGWLRWRSGSLYPGMLAHLLHNLLVVLAEARVFNLP